MSKTRGFEEVTAEHKTAFDMFKNEATGARSKFPKKTKLPTRADDGSAGYDFYMPKEVVIMPHQNILLFTDVKAFMEKDESLELYIRSSLAIKQGLVLSNAVGLVDSTYYNNESNNGNIGCCISNTSGTAVALKEGDRVMQGVFRKYLIADNDVVIAEIRKGGMGSSGK